MFSTTFEKGPDVVDTKIINYLKEAQLPNIIFRNVTSCDVYGCDKQSSNCALKGNSPVCECKEDYKKNHPLDVSCVKLEGSDTSTVSDNTMRDILIGVSTVAGVTIIGLTAGLIVMAMRKKLKDDKPASFSMMPTFSVKNHRDSEDGSQMTQRPPPFPKTVYNRHHDDEENDDDDDGSYAGKIKNQSFPQDQGRILSGNVYSFPKASVPSKPGGSQNFGYKPAGNPYNSSANVCNPYNSSANDCDPYNRTSTRGAAGNGSFSMMPTFSVKNHRDSEDGSQMTQRPPPFPKTVYNRHHDDEENDDDDDGSYAGKIKNQSFPQDQGRILSGNVYSFPKASVPSKPGGSQNFGYKPAGNPYNSSANDRDPYNSSANDCNPYNSSANDCKPYNSSANVCNPYNSSANDCKPYNGRSNDRDPYNSSANDCDPYNRTSTRGAAGNGYGHRGYRAAVLHRGKPQL
ncbi:uncharacterized protein [Lepisosteus oculatus]|uniref:uncharacterized protein n=1 Tax=Lepisosteus oculatus TaxID=7918 RepID=UPI0035F500BD